MALACATAASAANKGIIPNTEITIDVSSDDGQAAPLIGFVHGIAAPSVPDYDFPAETISRIAALQPTLWKVSDSRHYLKAQAFGAQIMYASSDAYFNYQAIYYPWNDTGTQWGRFDDWANFDANAVALLKDSLVPSRQVDYWGIINEPQFIVYSEADQQRLKETFSHGYHDFKDGHPEQRVVAPTTIGYSSKIITALLDYAEDKELRFDAIDWHELGSRPEDVVAHVDDLRALLAARPSLGSPPIIIDEYASSAHHLLPGFAVAWLHYLEKARVLLAARACWNVQDPVNGIWSDCWDGLNGLFMKDNLTPQPLYWVFERYAQMRGQRLVSSSTAPNEVVALARMESTDPGLGDIKILVGRFVSDGTQAPATAKDVVIHLEGFSTASGSLHVQIQRIPSLSPETIPGVAPVAVPLPQLGPAEQQIAFVEGGRATVVLPAFLDRDAYYLTLSDPEQIFDDGFETR